MSPHRTQSRLRTARQPTLSPLHRTTFTALVTVALVAVLAVPVALLVVTEPLVTTAGLVTLALTVHVARHAAATVKTRALKRLTTAVVVRR